MKYVLIKTDLTVELIDPPEKNYPPRDDDVSAFLRMCYDKIGCSCIESLRANYPYVFMVDESGAVKDPPQPWNRLLQSFFPEYPYKLHGNAILCRQSGSDIVPLEDHECMILLDQTYGRLELVNRWFPEES